MKGQYLSPPVDDRLIWDAWLAMHNLPAMLAADDIGLFDALVDGPLALDDLAARCDVNARALGITNSLLCGLGFLVRRDGRYGLTPTSRNYLVKTSNFYWGALLSGFRASAPGTELLLAALAPDAKPKGGDNAQGWEAGDIPLDRAIGIAAFMHAHSCAPAIGVAQHPVFADVKRFLDIGAGSGVFTIAVAQRWKELRGSVLDLGTMCTAAQKYIDEGEVADRVDTVPLDFFRQPWPSGYDAHFFSNVFHDWSDETCLELARKSFDALPSGGRIMLHEALINDNLDGPTTPASFSVLMLYGTQGRQFTLPEFKALLGKAGFVDCEATATCGYYSLVIARKP
ncbi:acetylserotonin N-methyltransferase [Sphingobium xanthum]|uniref:methyltransferase n=1 Tax=Sphingobium xanthum TaxID=1387165 RepID=UPI001C8C4B98|nr:methyltransferase [Sphingobium xanthum]